MLARPFHLLPLFLLLAAAALVPADQPAGPQGPLPLHLQVVEQRPTLPERWWRIEQPTLVRTFYYHLIDLPPYQNDEYRTICFGLWIGYTLTFSRNRSVLLRASTPPMCGYATICLDNGLCVVIDQRFWTLLNQAISAGVSRAPPPGPGRHASSAPLDG